MDQLFPWGVHHFRQVFWCRYRQKRHERNFNKRIKYMCRKTLADSRPRVRGRFARNDDTAAVMPHETKKALAEKARREKKANGELSPLSPSRVSAPLAKETRHRKVTACSQRPGLSAVGTQI